MPKADTPMAYRFRSKIKDEIEKIKGIKLHDVVFEVETEKSGSMNTYWQ